MNKFRMLIYLLITVNFACNKLPEDCKRFDNWEVISEKDISQVCNYQQIYMFNDEYFSVCECCNCDKAPVAVNCNGESLCDFTEGCMAEFFKDADLVYYAIEN